MKRIEDMSAEELRQALNLENARIKGANVIHSKIQMWAGFVAGLDFFIGLPLAHNLDTIAYPIGIALACWFVIKRNKVKPTHYLWGEGWEKEARAVLLDAEMERYRESSIWSNSHED